MTTTVHTPKNFDPAKCRAVTFLDNCSTAFAPPLRREDKKEFAKFFGERIPFRCEHCHHAIRWVAVVEFRETPDAEPEFVAFGKDCVERVEIENRVAFQLKHIMSDAARRAKAESNAQRLGEFLEGHPLVAAALEQFEERGDVNFSFFARDIARKVDERDLSEAQCAAFVQAVQRDIQRHDQRLAEAAAAGPVPAGHKVEVEGDIVSIKTQSNKWGETVKMLVKLNNGAKVWGTCPSTFLEADVSLGDRVKFVAGKIDASRDDASFGFFSRPTRAKIMAPAA